MSSNLAGHRTTTLFDLVAAVQESLTPEEEAAGLAVPVVQDLLHRVARRPAANRATPHSGLPVVHDAAA